MHLARRPRGKEYGYWMHRFVRRQLPSRLGEPPEFWTGPGRGRQ